MWFQDLFNYDFPPAPSSASSPTPRRKAKSASAPITPAWAAATSSREMHMTATLTKWYEEKGRHEIIAGGKSVNLPSRRGSLALILNARCGSGRHPARSFRMTKGLPRRPAKKKIRARNEAIVKKSSRRREDGKALSRSHPQGKPIEAGFVPISHLPAASSPPRKVEKKEEVGSFGD